MSAKKYKERSVPSASEGVELTRELIAEFIENIRQKGYVEGTLERYQRDLEQLRESLTGEKRVGKGTLEVYRRQMLEDGYAPRTVNLRISAANSLLGYLGLREYQLIDQVKPKKEALPEISRTEYLQLLRTARAMGRERVYLLVKLFATTDLPLQELSKVTVEAAAQGVVQAIASGIPQAVHLPPVLCRELLDYARRNGLRRGPIFLDQNGSPMSRTNVTGGMRQLCEAARIPVEKGTPRCLKRLYQSTLEEIESNVRLLIQETQDRMIEVEQATVGWREGVSLMDEARKGRRL